MIQEHSENYSCSGFSFFLPRHTDGVGLFCHIAKFNIKHYLNNNNNIILKNMKVIKNIHFFLLYIVTERDRVFAGGIQSYREILGCLHGGTRMRYMSSVNSAIFTTNFNIKFSSNLTGIY